MTAAIRAALAPVPSRRLARVCTAALRDWRCAEESLADAVRRAAREDARQLVIEDDCARTAREEG